MKLPASIKRRWHTGELIDIMNLEDEIISSPADVVTVLQRLARWGGSGRYLFPVADHSILVARLAFNRGERRPDRLLEYLLHDTTEAFINDMLGPLKRHLKLYQAIESHVRRGLAKAHFPIAEVQPDYVKPMDKMAEGYERLYLFGELEPGRESEAVAFRMSRGNMLDLWSTLEQVLRSGQLADDLLFS